MNKVIPSAPMANGRRKKSATLSVSISGEAGAGAPLLAEILAEALPSRLPQPQKKWRVVDGSLVSTALAQGAFPDRLHSFLREEGNGPMTRAVEDILSAHPRWSPTVAATARQVEELFQAGSLVLLSRDAHLLTPALSHVLYVRLIAPVEMRVARVQQLYRLSQREAAKMIKRCDHSGERALRKSFPGKAHAAGDFDLTVNLGQMPVPDAVDIITDAALALTRKG